MNAEATASFRVDSADREAITVSGPGAPDLLLHLILSAKFNLSPSVDVLLSPYVRQLIDALRPLVRNNFQADWSNPANLTPPEFLAVVEVVKAEQARNPSRPLNDLVREALYPWDVPMARLGLRD